MYTTTATVGTMHYIADEYRACNLAREATVRTVESVQCQFGTIRFSDGTLVSFDHFAKVYTPYIAPFAKNWR